MAANPSNGAPSPTSVWTRLYEYFSKPQRRPAGNQRPQHRGVAIMISVLVSVLLWFTFSIREEYTDYVQMPTEVVNVPEGMALASLPPPVVRVQVEGDGLSLFRLNLNPPSIPVNGAQERVDLMAALPELLPKNLRALNAVPASVTLEKERRVTRKVPIRLVATIETPSTHDLVGAPVISPDSVQITGAASIVGDIDRWPTEHVVYDNLRDSLEVRVPLSDTLVGLVERNIEATTLRVVSQPFTEDVRELDVTVTGEPTTEKLVELSPKTITVKYRVLFSQFAEAREAMDFFATVDYEQIRSDTTGHVAPRLHLPEGIVLHDIEIIPETLGYYERIE